MRTGRESLRHALDEARAQGPSDYVDSAVTLAFGEYKVALDNLADSLTCVFDDDLLLTRTRTTLICARPTRDTLMSGVVSLGSTGV